MFPNWFQNNMAIISKVPNRYNILYHQFFSETETRPAQLLLGLFLWNLKGHIVGSFKWTIILWS